MHFSVALDFFDRTWKSHLKSCQIWVSDGRQFYAVIKKDAFGGERLEKLPLNENVYIISYNYRSYSLIQRWIDSREENYVNDRIDNDG